MSKTILQAISELTNLRSIGGASEEDILAAEKELGLTFAPDYREYVATYGVISARGVEWSGVSTVARLHVVKMTKDERTAGSNIGSQMYVVENLGMEGIVVAQDHTGAVYWLGPGRQPEKAYDSLAEYLYSFKL